MSYALINPNFKVSTFNGYCDPAAVFGDIEPNEEFPAQRIEAVKAQTIDSTYWQQLNAVYKNAEEDTQEVVYFIEQVTGHLIPDMRLALAKGVDALREKIAKKLQSDDIDAGQRDQYEAMDITLRGCLLLAKRYKNLAAEMAKEASPLRAKQLKLMEQTLDRVPKEGARNLYEAIQSFLLLWQVMCVEQAPNPFAFSVGNADRIFEPYRAMEPIDRAEAAGLFKHFLVFFNVGSRSWAISQNVLVGGRDVAGRDLTNETTYALLDAYYAMNLPQPILSVKLHKNTPDRLYEELGKFFFTPGCLTPSLFNDDSVFPLLEQHGVDKEDLPDYAVAGCQEPLIMGKDNGNTTNSWFNLGKILELALHDGKSSVTGKQIGPTWKELGFSFCSYQELLASIEPVFYAYAERYAKRMADAANGASVALSHLPVPFLSCFMGGMETGVDTRDVNRQGTKYNASGCLIHGLSVVSDSFIAIKKLLEEHPEDAEQLEQALVADFEGFEELRNTLLDYSKYGNNQKEADSKAREVAIRISQLVQSQRNYLGNPFRADWSTPSTHLLYGYWVGATPDGRRARTMLNYGVDPMSGSAENGLGFRTLSARVLPYELFDGGYASHFGLDPKYFKKPTHEEKGLEFKTKIVAPLFFPSNTEKLAPFYLYLNVTTPETLRKVLAHPEIYAPSGIYIMRIHGTFVNFLDLSPDIQQDIIRRLDLSSTRC